MRKKVCDTIAEVAKFTFEMDEQQGNAQFSWPELLSVLFDCSKAPAADLRESVFLIFTAMPSLFSSPAGKEAISTTVLNLLKQTFDRALNDPESAQVRLAALKACVAFLLSDDMQGNASHRNAFAGALLVAMANVLLSSYNSETRNQEALVEGLSAFIDLSEMLPKLLREILPTFIPFLVSIVRDQDAMEDRSRQTALELLVTLAENAPGMCRKLSVSNEVCFNFSRI